MLATSDSDAGLVDVDDALGHYAGPLCYCTGGYNGYKVAVEEMLVNQSSNHGEMYHLLTS